MTTHIDPSEAALSGDHPLLDLPFDHRRVAGQLANHSGALPFSIAPDLTRQLLSLAEREGVSLSSVYLASYAILLSRHGNTPEVNIGSWTITQRSPGLVGMSSDRGSVAMVRTNCSPDLGFREFLHTVAASAGEQHSRNGAPADTELCHAGFIWENSQGIDRLSRLITAPSMDERFDLSLTVRSCRDVIEPALLYRSDLFEQDTVERMSRHLTRLFAEIVNRPTVSLGELDMIPADERALILGFYAGSSADFPQACLHQLFAEQVALRPEAEAVVFGSERLTYRQ
ncbi:MAG TPA: hypothetical protein VK638_48410, partial [Edaphobacter sp.]|nr:hypothetical protein [Edaphobacter sp.]